MQENINAGNRTTGRKDKTMTDTAYFGPGGNCEAFAARYRSKTIMAPQWVIENGLDAYEYEAGRGIGASPELFLAMGQEAARLGVRMSFHAPYFISLSSTEREKRDNSIRYIADSLAAARLLGARIIVVHTGSTAKMARRDALLLAADTVSRALETLPDNGVLIGLETMGKVNQLGTLDEVIELCSMDTARLAPVVDFGHLNARDCGGVFPDADAYKRLFDTIGDKLGDRHAKELHCHFSRIEYTTGGEKRHVTLADTAWGPDPEPLMRVLADWRLTPTIISESAGTQTADAAYMKQVYQQMQG